MVRYTKSRAFKIAALHAVKGLKAGQIVDTFAQHGEKPPSNFGVRQVIKRFKAGLNLQGYNRSLSLLPDEHWLKLKAALIAEPRQTPARWPGASRGFCRRPRGASSPICRHSRSACWTRQTRAR